MILLLPDHHRHAAGQEGQDHASDPDHGIAAGGIEQDPAQGTADESPHLMGQIGRPEKDAQPPGAIELCDQAGGRGHRRITAAAIEKSRDIKQGDIFRQQDQGRRHQDPGPVGTAQDDAIGESGREEAGNDAAHHGPDTVDRQGQGHHGLRKAVADILGIKMGLDDRHMIAAGKKGQENKEIGPVGNGLPENPEHRQLLRLLPADLSLPLPPTEPERDHEKDSDRHTETDHHTPKADPGRQLLHKRRNHDAAAAAAGTDKARDHCRRLLADYRRHRAHDDAKGDGARTGGKQDKGRHQGDHAMAHGDEQKPQDHQYSTGPQDESIILFQGQHTHDRLHDPHHQLSKGQDEADRSIVQAAALHDRIQHHAVIAPDTRADPVDQAGRRRNR